MTQKNTPDQAPLQQHARQISIGSFLSALLLPTVILLLPACLVILTNLANIDRVAHTTGDQYLPSFMDRQRTLLNIENLRRYVETLFSAENQTVRRTASINALALASESAFESDSGFAEYAPTVLAHIRNLTEARNRSEQALENIHEFELLFRDEVTLLALHTGLPPVPVVPHSSTHTVSPRDRRIFENYRAKTTEALAPHLALCRQAGDSDRVLTNNCAQAEYYWNRIGEEWQNRISADIEARSLWKKLDDILRQLSDTAYTTESVLTYKAIRSIQADAAKARTITMAVMAVIALSSLLIAFCIYRYIFHPVLMVTRILLEIRHGRLSSTPPTVRIREFQGLINQLPYLSRYLEELNVRSGRLAEEKDKYESLSYVDGLTGIANRRSFDNQLAAASHQGSLSILMLDVDVFKMYNDTLGHQAGDNALIAVAHAMQQALLRSSDQAFRYGGEEFAVILSDANEDAAMAVAARILITIRSLNIPHPSSSVAPILTVSIGVSTRNPGDDVSDEELVARADKALYRAKSSGRNRICVYQHGDPAPPKPLTDAEKLKQEK